jgi:hypothetical protein
VRNLGGLTVRKALMALTVAIVAGGIVLALVSNSALPSAGFGPVAAPSGPGFTAGGLTSSGTPGSAYGNTQLIGSNGVGYNVNDLGNTYQVTTTYTESTTTSAGTIPFTTSPSGTGTSGQGSNVTQGLPSGSGGSIEFSSQVALQASSPQQAASGVVALAYSVGGYVAYQSTFSSSANVVIRVPAADYQQVLAKVEALGTVESLTSNSNDVSVQYTDLNATLVSLQTEQGALLRLLNESTTINSTLAIEDQLQGVNQQINEVESQILQTRTLIDFATISVTVSETAQPAALSMSLTATPKTGEAPLSVTFNAVVKGGAQPYVVNYNFGDGFTSQGQILIHTYYQAGEYNVTVTATDQNGTSVEQYLLVHVTAVPGSSGVQSFFTTVSGLFVSVVEGIAEVAVVVLPIAAVGAAVIIPMQRRANRQKSAKPQ